MNGINEMVWNFAKELVLHAKDSFKKVSPVVYKERMEICLSCPALNQESKRCEFCGCFMVVKAGWRSSRCADPESPKWHKKEEEKKNDQG